MQRKAGRPSCLVRGVSWSASEGGLRRIGWRQGGGADEGQNHHNANTKLRKYIYTNTNIQQQKYRYKYLKTEDSSHKTQSFIIWVGTGPTDSWRYCTSWSYCTRRLAKILFMRRVGEVSTVTDYGDDGGSHFWGADRLSGVTDCSLLYTSMS